MQRNSGGRRGASVSEHCSWNRTPLSGYRVIFVPFRQGMPVGWRKTIKARC